MSENENKAEWYLLGRDTRHGMMNGHIGIGKRFREITQPPLFTKGETPLHTGVLIPAEEWAESLG